MAKLPLGVVAPSNNSELDPGVLSRLLRGLGANAFGQMVTLVIQLVGVPILLHAWGAELYGEWIFLFAIPAYLAMSDLGFSHSAANDMTARFARGDRDGALAVYQTLLAIICVIATSGICAVAAVLWLTGFVEALPLQVLDAGATRWVLLLLAINVFAGLFSSVADAGFRASGDYALQMSLFSTVRLAQFGGVWTAALAGGDAVIAAAAFCAVRVATAPLQAVLLTRRHEWLTFGLAHSRLGLAKKLLRPAVANLAFPAAQALQIQGMVLVVGYFLGPVAVVVFSTLRTLTRLAVQAVHSVTHSAEPELAAAYGARNAELMHALFVHSFRAALWLALAAATVLAVFGEGIVHAWTGGAVAIQGWLFGWLLASGIASVFWYVALIALKAANRHLHAALLYLTCTAGSIAAASFALAQTNDLSLAGLALLIADLLMAVVTLISAGRLLRVRPMACLSSAANPLLLIQLGRASWREAFSR